MALLLNAGDTVSRSYSYTQPSPLHPIQPSECGDITANILSVYKENYSISANGEETYDSVAMIYKANVAVSGSTFTLTFGGLSVDDTVRIHAYTGDTWQSQITSINITQVPLTFTVASDVDNIRVSIRKTATDVTMTDGQYKIPISSANTTTPVYLGEVETTRKIGKLVLTGEEDWEVFSVGTGRYFRYMISSTVTAIENVGICSHYKQGNIDESTINTDVFTINAPSEGGNDLVISPSDVTIVTASDFETYLQQQYAADTPVCVWYVHAEPTTGIVNEPIRKIGDYADEVSGITIPIIAGTNTISVDTALQPSEVTVNYKSWRPVQSTYSKAETDALLSDIQKTIGDINTVLEEVL